MSDEATFSTGKVAPYQVDGASITQVYQKMLKIAFEATAPEHVYGEIEVKSAIGEHGRRTAKSYDPRHLLDGSIPFPESVHVSVGGHIYDENRLSSTFHISFNLDPSRGDHIYANGPSALASASFDMMLAAIAECARPAEEIKKQAKPLLQRDTVYYGFLLAAMLSVGPSIYLLDKFGIWTLFIPAILMLASLTSLASKRSSAIKTDPPKSIIDLSVKPVEAPRQIGYAPLIPLEVS